MSQQSQAQPQPYAQLSVERASAESQAEMESEKHMLAAMEALDLQPRDRVESHAGDELVQRPPSLKHQRLTRDQYVLRQWILRDQLAMLSDVFSHEQMTAHDAMPPWLMYEMLVEGEWWPARVVQARRDGRKYCVSVLKPQGLQQCEADRRELRRVNQWSNSAVQLILSQPGAGLFTDPLSVWQLLSTLEQNHMRTKP